MYFPSPFSGEGQGEGGVPPKNLFAAKIPLPLSLPPGEGEENK